MDYLARAKELKKTLTWEQVYDTLTREYGGLDVPNANALRVRTQRYKGTIQYEDRKLPATPADVDGLIDLVIQLQEKMTELDTKQTKAKITISDDRPFAIVWSGDWHTGAKGMDYRLWRDDLRLIRDTSGLYLIGTGDYRDQYNALAPTGGNMEAIIQVGLQDELALWGVDQVAKKALAWVRGCHDDWSYKADGRDFIAEIAERTEAVNLWHGGILDVVTRGGVEYRLATRHKFGFSSQLNTTNSQRNLYNMIGGADVVMLAHFHFADMQEKRVSGRHTVWGRAGGYKIGDEYGQKIGGYEAEPIFPMVIFDPYDKQMTPFRDFKAGLRTLEMMRR